MHSRQHKKGEIVDVRLKGSEILTSGFQASMLASPGSVEKARVLSGVKEGNGYVVKILNPELSGAGPMLVSDWQIESEETGPGYNIRSRRDY